MIANLVIITYYDSFGFKDESSAVRIAFIMVGLWWFGFAQIPFKRLPADNPNPLKDDYISKGFKELQKVWKALKKLTFTKRFLISFFFYNAGVQTILFLAATFAEKELNYATSDLIILILILQIVAIIGAYLFAKVSDWKGNKAAISVMLVIWILLCIMAYLVETKTQFYIIAVILGSVMGGTQSLSRSTYSKLIPKGAKDTTSYFSFYDVLDKVSTMIGTFGFGLVQLLGGMRDAVLGLSAFFLIGLIILSTVKIANSQQAEPSI